MSRKVAPLATRIKQLWSLLAAAGSLILRRATNPAGFIAQCHMYSPSLEEFLELAAQGNLIPVTRRLLADIETPLAAYRKIRGHGEAFLFESVEGGEHLGRYSFVGCNPRAVIRQDGAEVKLSANGKLHRNAFEWHPKLHPQRPKAIPAGQSGTVSKLSNG